MGSLALENHWAEMVLASVREFHDAEDRATRSESQADVYLALRRGMTAAIFLHHFAEVAINRDGALKGVDLGVVYDELGARTRAADNSVRPNDWRILKNVADAIKHAELTKGKIVHVARNGRVIEWTHDHNNHPLICVPTDTGPRSLRELLQNICETWSAWQGLPRL